MIDGVPTWELIQDLRRVKLPKTKREIVVTANVELERRGSIGEKRLGQLRKMYRDYSLRIRELKDAQERARITIAKGRMNLSDSEVKSRRLDRIDELRKSAADLGF